ncbi:MAG: zinc ABC transporter solute-binding protein [Bacteroidales bacterium]|nr:zinc ABC transporter solute-binding protein [Bacteroidales bacterium]
MKRIYKYSIVATIALLLLAACGQSNDKEGANSDKHEPLKVVTTFTIIKDIAHQIGGDDIDIHNLVPTGAAPHEYEPLPTDMKKTSDADILFYNGLNLEGGKNGWFFKMINSVGQKEENVYSLTKGVEPMYLSDKNGRKEEVNPHSFINPAVGIIMAKNMRDILIERDPARKENYEERTAIYLDKLRAVDQEYKDKINAIPKERRILVTSEHAFQYMTKEYGLNEAYIWSIDTEETGSPEQIKALISFIKEHNVPILFVESNVDKRPMQMVSKETQVPISKKHIYSDELDKPGGEVDTYIKFLQRNIKLIYDELK